ncbi:MAG: hypothetical protein B7Y70_06400 [Rhizobiales bacterium 35-68-8]|nr:MAG: hypothetical protein B7Y70_06400 [Rhizobiales bacterium 35-68-8]
MSDDGANARPVDDLIDQFLAGRIPFEKLTERLRKLAASVADRTLLKSRLQMQIDGQRLSVSLAQAIYGDVVKRAPAAPPPPPVRSSDTTQRPAGERMNDALVGHLVDRFLSYRDQAPAEPTAPSRALDEGLQSFLSLRLRKEARRAGMGTGGGGLVDTTEPGIGTILRDRFVIDSELGRGGMGIVYRAVDRRRLDTGARQPYVALKLLNADFGAHPDALRALETETRRAQELPHPCIVTVYDFDRDGGRAFIVMELLEGVSLDRAMRQRPDFIGSDLARSVVASITDALAFAHAHGVVHADLKPANVLLCDDGRTKLLDFGISAALQTGETEGFDTASLAAVTPAYASPQRDEGAPATPADDVYALGCMIHLLMTGKHPFGRKSGGQAQEEGLQPPPLTQCTPGEAAAVRAALAFDLATRPADAAAFRHLFR